MASEKSLVNRVLRELNSWDHTKAIKIHGSLYGRVGTPDILGCTHGRMFTLEAKSIGKSPSKIQHHELRQWELAGATVRWFTSYQDAIDTVRSMASDIV